MSFEQGYAASARRSKEEFYRAFPGPDPLAFLGERDPWEPALAKFDDEHVFHLVEPGPDPTRYDQLLQSGPRQKLKRDLQATIDRDIGHLTRSLVVRPNDPDLIRVSCERTVLQHWRPA
ncbi:MAG TPA: hypothetical protein VIG36_11345 [Methylocystis sp.]